MKHLIAILALSVSLFSTNAQCFLPNTPFNRITIGAGFGYGSRDRSTIANLQIGYCFDKIKLDYSQTMFTGDSKPAFFEAKAGYEIGDVYSITPHAGLAYRLSNFDNGDYTAHITYGAQFAIRVDQFMYADPKIFLDIDRIGKYNLFLIGFKASL